MTTDLLLPYSGYNTCKEFLRKTTPENTLIYTWSAKNASSLLAAMLPHKFYALDTKEYISYHPHNYKKSSFVSPVLTLKQQTPPGKVVILSLAEKKELKLEETFTAGKYTYKKVFSTGENTIDAFERYAIYFLVDENGKKTKTVVK